MQCLFTKDIKDEEELKQYIKDNKIDIPEYRTAVIALIIDSEGRLILQRRGPKSRDEYLKLEDIGGAVEETDEDFKSAIMREIEEEAGPDAKIEIDHFVGAFLVNKFDRRTDKYVNWLFLLYKCNYLGGELKIAEEGKCIGYEFYKYEDLPKEETANTTLAFWDFYFQEYVNKKD